MSHWVAQDRNMVLPYLSKPLGEIVYGSSCGWRSLKQAPKLWLGFLRGVVYRISIWVLNSG